jgi:hypothetical protein
LRKQAKPELRLSQNQTVIKKMTKPECRMTKELMNDEIPQPDERNWILDAREAGA